MTHLYVPCQLWLRQGEAAQQRLCVAQLLRRQRVAAPGAQGPVQHPRGVRGRRGVRWGAPERRWQLREEGDDGVLGEAHAAARVQ